MSRQGPITQMLPRMLCCLMLVAGLPERARGEAAQEVRIEVNVLGAGEVSFAEGSVSVTGGGITKREPIGASGRSQFVVKPGSYVVSARHPELECGAQWHTVVAGTDWTVNLECLPLGAVAGRIMDDSRNPVAGARVTVRYKLYSDGMFSFATAGSAVTDESGEYSIGRLQSGIAYYIHANPRIGTLAGTSKGGVITADGYYPSAPELLSAVPVLLKPGEKRELIDIVVRRVRTHCVAVSVIGVPATAAKPTVSLYKNESGGPSVPIAFALIEAGKARLCGVSPGSYRLSFLPVTGEPGQPPLAAGFTDLQVTERDVETTVSAQTPLSVPGTVRWKTDNRRSESVAGVRVVLVPLGRNPFKGEILRTTTTLPGSFELVNLLPGYYQVRTEGLPSDLYTEDILLSGISVLGQRFRIGDTIRSELEIVVESGTPSMSVRVTSQDNNPISGVPVFVIPQSGDFEHWTRTTPLRGYTDSSGTLTFNVRPGSYHVLASTGVRHMSEEALRKVWAMRKEGHTCTIQRNDRVAIRIEPSQLR